MSDGTGYSARHLEHSDYNAQGERVTGDWQGRGVEAVRQAGEVCFFLLPHGQGRFGRLSRPWGLGFLNFSLPQDWSRVVVWSL
jgi:hypothetical protein